MGYLYPARGKALQWLIWTASTSALALYGWDAGVLSGILGTPQFETQINAPNTEVYSFISSGILLGDVIGCLFAVYFTWGIGRKNSIVLSCWVGLIGVAIQASAYGATQIIIGRVILGMGNGALSSLVPVFVNENSIAIEAEDRTKKVMITVGISIAAITVVSWLGYGVYYAPYLHGWRWLLASQAPWLIIGLVILHFVMDSPRFYYSKGRIEEGDDSLSRLHGKPITDPAVKLQREQILASVRLEQADSELLTWKSMFTFRDETNTKVKTRIWLSWILQPGVPLFGGNLIIYYGKSILSTLTLTVDQIAVLAASLNTAQTVGIFFSYWAVQYLGRRTILIWGSVLQLIALIIFTVLGTLDKSKITAATQWTQVGMLFLFQVVKGFSWMYMVYLYCVEIVPTRYRGQANAIGSVVVWALAFTAVYAGPIAIQRDGVKIFTWFICTGAVLTYVVIFHMKETKGLTLDEIDLLWASEEFKARNRDAQIVESAEVEIDALEGSKKESDVESRS